MNRIQTAAIALTLAFAAAGAHAQPLTKMQTEKMAACHKMSNDAMMKDAECMKLSKMHDDSMTKKDGMMKSDGMKSGAMTPKGGAMAPKSGM